MWLRNRLNRASDHLIVQIRHCLTRRSLTETRDQRMNCASRRCAKQFAREAQRRALMLEIAFPDILRVVNKPALQHGESPEHQLSIVCIQERFFPKYTVRTADFGKFSHGQSG